MAAKNEPSAKVKSSTMKTQTATMCRDRFILIAVFLLAFGLCKAAEPAPKAKPGDTKVLKWQDGKKAVFMLAFDDSAPSQLKNVIPELEKRKIVGTFYLVTGNSLYAGLRLKWERAAQSPYVEVANHSFTHRGVTSAEQLNPELEQCNEVLYRIHPERKQPRLMGFGQPGGVPWKVSKDEEKQALAKYHLVERPPFYGPPMHYKSPAEMVAAVDAALAKGEMGHMDFHGVGGDWLVTPIEWFSALLDKLEASRDQLWITDTASWHKYVTERQGAEVKLLHSGEDSISIELTSQADSALYDLPLTLATQVPAEWKSCLVVQGALKTAVPVTGGTVQYSALPGGGEISIRPLAPDAAK